MDLLNPTRNVLTGNNPLQAQALNGTFINPESYTHGWTVTNATVTVDSTTTVHPLNYSLRIQPLDEGSTIKISLNNIIPIDNDINGSQAQFHCQFYSPRELTINGKITNVTANTFKTNSQNLIAGKWDAAFTPAISVGLIDVAVDDIEFGIELDVLNHGGQVFYFSMPILMNELGFTKNMFVRNMRKFIPTFIWDKDKIQEYPNYPFAKFFHVLTYYGSKSSALYVKYFEYLNSEISPENQNATFRFSELIDPEHVDSDYVNWLSQFNGVPTYSSITSEANTESVDNVDESLEWQLTNAYFGRNSGTLVALKECAQQVLTGNKVVYVFPGGSFFQINVYTLLSETPGVQDPGDSSPEVVAFLKKTKPMGFILNHESYAALPLILDDATYGILGGPTAPSAPGLA